MARSKQTARKSTGGKAARRQLATKEARKVNTSNRWCVEATQIQARHGSAERDQEVPEEHGAADPKAEVPEAGERDRSGLQDRSEAPE
uniref:Core histone H2A/H2B/H3/H4 n=1 Tax=Rhizophora mucronata TaxID=61149 RepID=A0A2P2K679_RHIMU